MNVIAKGIDISSWNGIIDFDKVKAAGYQYVIIKAGQGRKEFDSFKTPGNREYLQKAQAAGMNWGAYWWSDAVTVQEAKQEANAFLNAIKGLKPTYPVYMDQEYDSPPARLGNSAQAKQLRTDMVKAFLDTLQDAGYYAGLYSSTDWLQNLLDDTQLKSYDKWVAQYASRCTYTGDYGMWQHHGGSPGFIGQVTGVNGPVDINDCYLDYPSIIKAHGLNGWKPGIQITPEKPVEPDYKALYIGLKEDIIALYKKYETVG